MRYLGNGILIFLSLFANSFLSAQTKSALFLGNSYTYYNNLPLLVSNLTLSMGDTLEYDMNAPGGYRLMNHATNTTTYQKIDSRDWDYVFLQAQSQEPSFTPEEVEVDVFPYAKKLADTIRYNYACTELVFYETWGRLNGDELNCDTWPPVCSYWGMSNRLLIGYLLMARQNMASIAPVGLAWQQVRLEEAEHGINLYASDGGHPSVAGSYLAACVMYRTIFKKKIENANFYSTLDSSTAVYLQSKANRVFESDFLYELNDTIYNENFVFDYATWHQEGHSVLAELQIDLNAFEITCHNHSVNAETYNWQFGDGNISTDLEPIHNYSTAGQFMVQLAASNSCSVDSAAMQIEIIETSVQIPDQIRPSLSINNGNINIQGLKSQYKSLDLYNLNGLHIQHQDISGKDFVGLTDKLSQKALLLRLTLETGESISYKIVF